MKTFTYNTNYNTFRTSIQNSKVKINSRLQKITEIYLENNKKT